MARPKTALAAWVKEQRQGREWKSEELALRLGVSDSTVRGWESGRTISDANLAALELLFDREYPGRAETPGEMTELLRHLEAQTAAVNAQTAALSAQTAALSAQTAALSALVEVLRPVAGPLGQQVADLQWAVQRLFEQAGLGSPKPPVRPGSGE